MLVYQRVNSLIRNTLGYMFPSHEEVFMLMVMIRPSRQFLITTGPSNPEQFGYQVYH